MKLFRYSLFVFLFCNILNLQAEEGLWLPYLLDNEVLTDMQAKGCKLSAEDIFNINEASLNDAIVSFGGFCTGSFISDKGLLVTNHHCGYDYIRKHSSTENNFLENGFWASGQEEELPNSGAFVRILKKADDITGLVLMNIPDSADFSSRRMLISYVIDSLESVISDSLEMKASIEGFYHENVFYLFLYEEYNDVRLVGAPPSSIGKFGGETDNWVWPRHNADFSLFRVYTDTLGKPAEYNTINIPYVPAKHLKISLEGVREGDFTMVFGYPGRTNEYMTSAEIRYVFEKKLPAQKDILDVKLEFLESVMKTDEQLNLMYASVYAGASNTWKKWKGVLFGMKSIDLVQMKNTFEKEFLSSLSDSISRNAIQDIYRKIDKIYMENESAMLSRDVLLQTIFSMEFAGFIYNVLYELRMQGANYNPDFISSLEIMGEEFYRNYLWQTDVKLSAELLTAYLKHVPPLYYPQIFREMQSPQKEDIYRTLKRIFSRSVFKDEESFKKALKKLTKTGKSVFNDDGLTALYYSLTDVYYSVDDRLITADNTLDSLHQEYMRILLAGESKKEKLYPDANSTFRMSYGQIRGYDSRDAVGCRYYTTLKGVIEKSYEDNPEYEIPSGLKMMFTEKDYKPYSLNDTMPVCFIATNHTSGGNSGSPVLNAEGHLIGINFDRNWEGTVGDYFFDGNVVRNISVDIRYILYLIDKYAGAGYLIDEMDIMYQTE